MTVISPTTPPRPAAPVPAARQQTRIIAEARRPTRTSIAPPPTPAPTPSQHLKLSSTPDGLLRRRPTDRRNRTEPTRIDRTHAAMSLPGLSLPGLSMSAAPPPSAADVLAPSSAPRTQDLAPGTEYRFEVPFNATLTVKLLNGTAECFGTELACNAKEPYLFRAGTKAAIFTWHGCRLQVEGDVESEYQAEETPMVEYANVHFALERLRDAVSTMQEMGSGGEKPIGPRVLVVGPENAGKTSLVRLLTAYGVKMGRQPVVVNLDPRQGMLSPPGSLATATMASVLDVEEGWGSSPINGPSPVPVKMPLVYHFGLGSPDDNPKMYRGLVTRLALAVTSRLGEDDEARKSGCIIDTPGVLSVDKKGVYENIQHVVSEFSGVCTMTMILPDENLRQNSAHANLLSACLVHVYLQRFSSERHPRPRFRAPIQRSFPPFLAPRRGSGPGGQARQVRRVCRPRRDVYEGIETNTSAVLLLRPWLHDTQPAHATPRLQLTPHLPHSRQ